jgi:hypothetical protein
MLYEKFISSLLFFSTLVSSISTKRKSISNYFVWYKGSIVFLISITLVCSSSLYVSPSAFSTTYPSPSHSSSKGIFSDWGGQYSSEDGQMRAPAGIALDQEGNVYVADTGNNRIQVFSSNGTFITKWGGGGEYHSSADGQMRAPAGIASDSSSGNVYVADTGNNRIQVFSSNGTFITKWGGQYKTGRVWH